jgi:hypothetical protein
MYAIGDMRMPKEFKLSARELARMVSDVASLKTDGSDHQAETKDGIHVPGPGKIGKVSGIDVFLVDGNWVKLNCNMDFVEGGNDGIYDYMAKQQIWIDSDLDHTQVRYIALHEAVERRGMESGLSYDDAHNYANEIEKEVRKDNVLGPA